MRPIVIPRCSEENAVRFWDGGHAGNYLFSAVSNARDESSVLQWNRFQLADVCENVPLTVTNLPGVSRAPKPFLMDSGAAVAG